MKIGIAADHAGFALKEELKTFLTERNHEVKDFGAYELDPEDDYPDFVIPAARAVADGEVERAIVIGSSGQGEGIAANRIKGVRALVYYGERPKLDSSAKVGTEHTLIQASRIDNDSNVLSLGASFISVEEAKEAVEEWFNIPFTEQERHMRRIKKLDA